jgi:hypothetical protein
LTEEDIIYHGPPYVNNNSDYNGGYSKKSKCMVFGSGTPK